MSTIKVNPDSLKLIFREYDIRGIAGTQFEPQVIKEYEKWYGNFPGITITPETARSIGRALGTHLKNEGNQTFLVGFEERPHADELKSNFIEGILDTGINVDDAGLTCTPFIYFLAIDLNYDAGINITGSHNVYFYNGFKIIKKHGAPLYGEELQELYKIIVNNEFKLVAENERGQKRLLEDAFQIYKANAIEKTQLKKKVKIVIDSGNGASGPFVREFFEGIGAEVVHELYTTPDSYFPNHIPDPESPFNMQELMNSVKEHHADLGIGFDADADRVGFINEKGEYIFGDEILLLFSKKLAEKYQGKKILYDTKCSQLFEELLPQWGLTPLMHRTGHSPIKNTIQHDEQIILGGEMSGHYYIIEDYFGIDDGFMAAANLLELLAESNQSISELLSFLPHRVRTPEIKLPCDDDKKFDIIEKIKNSFESKYETITIDGVRVRLKDNSWGLIRPSNTSAYLTLRFEAKTEEQILENKRIFDEELSKYPEIKDKLNTSEIAAHTGRLGYV